MNNMLPPRLQLHHLGIYQRVLLLAIIPVLIVTSLLTTYHVYTRLHKEHEDLQQTGNQLIGYIATAAEFALFSGDRENLAVLARAGLRNKNVGAILFLDAKHRAIQQFYPPSDANLPQQYAQDRKLGEVLKDCVEQPSIYSAESVQAAHKFGRFWIFSQPVVFHGIDINDNPELNKTHAPQAVDNAPIGWAILILDERETLRKQTHIIVTSLLLSGATLIAVVLLALRIGGSISKPLARITAVVSKLEQDDLAARVPLSSGGELGRLEKGINRLGEQVAAARTELQRKIDAATARLRGTLTALEEYNLALLTAKEQAEAANTAKDIFLARMSHELRTPLTSILGFTKMLAETELSTQQLEYNDIVNRASSLLLSIIDDILSFSRLQSAAINLECIEFDLIGCVEDIIAMHMFNAHRKQLELVLLVDSDVPVQVCGDPLRLQQIFTNMLGNALKFTATGEIIVQLSALSLGDDTVTLQILVKDSGEGIAEDALANLFQPFVQGDISISRRHGGAGLGLAITKSLVELMSGNIEMRSKLDEGTEVTIQIPLGLKSTTHRAALPGMARAGEVILICDANPWVRRALRNQLLKWTRHIYVCANHDEALQKMQSTHFDIIFLGVTDRRGHRRQNDSQQSYLNQIEKILLAVRAIFRGAIVVMAGASPDNEILPDILVEKFAPVMRLTKPTLQRNLATIMRGLLGATDGEHALAAAPHKAALANLLAGLRLLVCEDNELNLRLLEMVLSRAGASVRTASNGKEAIAACEQAHFDVILMDIHMPEMDGIEAARHIRQARSSNCRTPIIALTANVIDSERQALSQVGVACTLYKPLDENALLANVARCGGCMLEDAAQLSAPRDALITLAAPERQQALQKELSALKLASTHWDWQRIRHHSHQLRGLSGLFGIKQLLQLAESVDAAALANATEELMAQTAAFERCLARLESIDSAIK